MLNADQIICKPVFDIIQVVKGDICNIDADIIVDSTDEFLSGSGGVDRAIQNKAGNEVKKELEQFRISKGRLNSSEIFITSAGQLRQNKQIYYVVGPKWNYDNCLAYIIYLQRLGYWSGGLELPLYDQIANGVIRRVLQRMIVSLE